jgi:hypothetical protein
MSELPEVTVPRPLARPTSAAEHFGVGHACCSWTSLGRRATAARATRQLREEHHVHYEASRHPDSTTTRQQRSQWGDHVIRTRSNRSRLDGLASIALIGVGSALIGCASAAPETASPSGDVAPARQNLSVDSLLCTALDILPKAVSSVSSHCDRSNIDNLHYEGGFVPTGGLGDLFQLPPLTNTMLQCAVAHSQHNETDGLAPGAVPPGVIPTSVGQFGMSSQFTVNGQGVSPTQFVEGERIGTIYLFGAQARLDVESLRFESAQEQRAAGTIQAAHVFTNEAYTQNVDARTGVYLHAESESMDWGIGGTVTIPGPIEVIITPNASHTAFYESMNNNLVAPVGSINTAFDFNTQLALELNCISGCNSSGLCVCQSDPSASQLSEHERLCNGGTCDYTNLADGVLPYDGALGGAIQTSLYDVPMVNWFHFGPSGPGGGLADGTLASEQTLTEPSYDLGGSQDQQKANTTFGLGIGAGYSLGPASISVSVQTDVKLRSAFAVRQRHEIRGDNGDTASLETALDSQSGVGIGLDLKIDFGIFGFTGHFPIWDSATANKPQPLVTINYTPAESSAPESFVVNGEALDPDTEIGNCLQQPVSGTPVVGPDDPASFLTNVATNFVTNIHPCKAALCDDSTVLTTCSNWDPTARKLVCVTNNASCNTCDPGQNFVTMCGTDNNVLLDENGQEVTELLTHSTTSCVR